MPAQAKTAKRTTKRPTAPEPATGPALVRISTTTTAPVETVPLFAIDDVEYSIPKKVPRSVVLGFARVAREEGQFSAAQWALQRLLGKDSYLALEESDQLEDEHLDQIIMAVIHHLTGEAEEGKA